MNKESENKRMGSNFLGILNDIKRRPVDAANELEVSLQDINQIIQGKKELSWDIVSKAIDIWPINPSDFFIVRDDCPSGVKIMKREDSEKSSRIMERAGNPYYEYRDTVMSCVGPFRPEWIMELCMVGDNHPENPDAQWNNGHFMHQFTYFIGDVNFYYVGNDGKKQVSVMNTGDSNYITPFTPHSFATRKGAQKNGLILALTYGNKLTGDAKNELSALGIKLGSEYALDFSTRERAAASLLKFHRELGSITIEELSKRTGIDKERLETLESGTIMPEFSEYENISSAIGVNVRNLLPNDSIENKVIIQPYAKARRWFYPEKSKSYEMVELASTKGLPSSKALEIKVLKKDNGVSDLNVGLHQYGYNVGDSDIRINWQANDKEHSEIIRPGDSFYIKPFVSHGYSGIGKLLILRIGGNMAGDSQIELSLIGKQSAERAINETMPWFNAQGKN